MVIRKAKIDSNEDEQELKHFIQMAYQTKISWKALAIIIDHKTPTLDKSKQALKSSVKIFKEFTQSLMNW